jgi:peroxiredoxin
MTGRGWGIRARRYSLLVEDGVVKKVNIEAPGKYEVSGAEAMLAEL